MATATPYRSVTGRELGEFVPDPITVKVAPMLRIQGYTDLPQVRPVVQKTAESMATLAEKTFKPTVRFRRVAVKSYQSGVLSLETGTQFHCDAFSKFLLACQEVVVFVLTVGSDFDRALDTLHRDEKVVEALFLESAGWLGVESVTRDFSQHLRTIAAQHNQKLTRRMSPGYSFRVDGTDCEWSLFEQHELFELFAHQPIPVRILESGAMLPKMSRSGLFGFKRL